jgi:uncharacterized phage protein (TIGR02218 family)
MKTADAQLIAFLNSAAQCLTFDLWTITLQSGSIVRWTDADIDILDNGYTFTRGPIITRSRCKWSRGIEVDHLTLTLAGSTVTVDAQLLPTFAAAGGFDAAKVRLDRVYFDIDMVKQGTLAHFFDGEVSNLTPARMGAKLSVKSALAQLQQKLPRNTYQAACMNSLFDSNCGINRAANTRTGTVTAVAAGNNPTLTVSFSSSIASGWLDLGISTITRGANTGISRTIQAQTGTGTSVTLQFSRPFPFALSIGDTLSATAGCNKLVTTCGDKFNNLIRFRGQPFIPAPETVL